MRALITGGAGFVGSNIAWHLLSQGMETVVFDNMSRGLGCEYNISWLKTNQNEKYLTIIKDDVRNFESISKITKDIDVIIHTGGQPSVTISISDPKLDFDVNVIGTFNVLEAARISANDPFIIYFSSMNVYGIPEFKLMEKETRYDFMDNVDGVDETHHLKGEEPYGVSKSVGDQYLRAYSSIYGLKGVSFRASNMYGPRQWGKEEQGWVAWFLIAFELGHPITIYGNGKQVRDLLYIDDVIEAVDGAINRKNVLKGDAINLGGGKENTVSLLEAIDFLEKLTGKRAELHFSDWRPRDNIVYYTNYRKANELLGWRPKVSWKDGVTRTYRWIKENINTIRKVYESN